MKLRKFNDQGVEKFREFLVKLKEDKTLAPPTAAELLENDALTEVIDPATECPDAKFANRLEAAAYLDGVLGQAGKADAFDDVGMWAWLALRFFGQLCPVEKDGSRDPGALYRFIPEVDQNRRYYRQLLLGPSVVYQAHRDEPHRVVGLLADPVTVGTSEVFRSFIENPALIRSRSAVEAATLLYYDANRKKIRRGAGAGGKVQKPGSCRRLISVLQQFDCTYDLYSLTAMKLLSMLPHEFDQFQPAPLLNETLRAG